MKPILEKYMPLDSNTSSSTTLSAQRQKDHYSHFILRLAFSSTEDLRRRFNRFETLLFRLRLNDDTARDRNAFIHSLNIDWELVSEEERNKYSSELTAMSGFRKGTEEESWYKVNWERVPDLIESRRVFLRAGTAYVPSKELPSMVVAEFTKRLDRALEVSSILILTKQEYHRLIHPS